MPPLETSPYQLLVEGRDDQHSILHLLQRHGYNWNDVNVNRPFIAPKEGFQELLVALPVAIKGPYERIGAVLDANANLAGRWAQIRDRLTSTGVALPPTPDPAGTIVTGIRPDSKVGVWLMPDNRTPGRLEDFLATLVPAGDPCWPLAEEVVVEARGRGAKCKAGDHVKSVIHTWLAWQEDPGLPFGTALRANVFTHDTEDAQRFVEWFQRLFPVA